MSMVDKVQVCIRPHSIELGIENPESVRKLNDSEDKVTRLISKLDGVMLRPESLSQCCWADECTFQCRVVVDGIVSDFDTSSLLDMLKLLRGRVTGTKYAELLSSGDKVYLQCSMCSSSLLQEDSALKDFKLVPSNDDWMDEMSADWFCCSGENYYNQISEMAKPTAERCFLNEESIFIHRNCLKNICVSEHSPAALLCSTCFTEVGCFFRRNRSQTSICHLFHYSVNLFTKPVDSQPVFKSFLLERFEHSEKFFAWLILMNTEMNASRKFAFKSFDNKPKLLVWYVDTCSIFLNGRLTAKSGSPPLASKSFPVIKILYKVFDESSASDPRANGHDGSVDVIHLPLNACTDLTETLLLSTCSLPKATRKVGLFNVGYLRLMIV